MTQPVSRRNALGMFSTIGLGALLASCSSGGEGTASAPMTGPTDDETYLRGTQVTNAERVVEFVTIYPGSTADGPCTSTARCTWTRPPC